MPNIWTTIQWVSHEFGLHSVYHLGLDGQLVILARTTRMLAYGACSLIIALLFSALNFSDSRIGLFFTLTLAGDVLLTTVFTLTADHFGRRRSLLLGSFLMVCSGLVFVVFDNYWILLLAAVVGVISATGSDFGPFRAIEESILSHLTTAETRPSVFAWYVTLSSLGSALGTEASGRVVDWLSGFDGWSMANAYHAVFWFYVVMGLANMVFIASMTKGVEINGTKGSNQEERSEMLLEEMQEEELGEPARQSEDEGRGGLDTKSMAGDSSNPRFAQISSDTRAIMFKLWPLLVVDSLADGMVGYSLTTYYLAQRFRAATSTLGDITSISYFFSATSTVFAGPLANRLGLVNTMVFTHLPSSIAVLIFPAAPNLVISVLLFFIRTGFNNMDQAPRAAFIAAAVKPEERTAVNGITSVLRTLAATAGPSVTGLLADHDKFWIAFVTAGTLRISYDLGLWMLFTNVRINERGSRS
ncbi:hypothetical protein P7C73_g1695, partial [Tremellales sp. Uapishka_1]